MRIVFHGENAASFSNGFAELLDAKADIRVLPDVLSGADREAYAAADVIVATKFDASLPVPPGLKLFHVPGAGYDAVDLAALPPATTLCNCFGHEQAIAEYVMSALLARNIPLSSADTDLRKGQWTYWAGAPERVHGEIAGTTIGLLGFGHIGKAIAARAKAFEMKVVVANRSKVATSALVDRAFTLDQLDEFWGSADAIVVSVPFTDETKGIVGTDALAKMRPDAVIINVGRGPTIDEAALYEALKQKTIGGAIIDTWYQYPGPGRANPQPSALPFHELPNIVMTPHMSGWTTGTIRRRQQTIADNVGRRLKGEACINVVREGRNTP
ncbi:phosphoglycerate dehydrogenase [Bosea caraganae]|uniref:Phosphoglycerate dehydrogenase n=1 Tax=Bosea caraganae TaxID=2763117 RepID=A0A370L790_9HYPH|nr:2-hydroxyacid dehydrogenase [Bosea caraganae]RDJ25481.1 phosphoglycerate dehydrogenase [Bosea caraganae]RDJ25734.1 phosphoglycerate dehydrogenase [Bosea caraganae]